MINIGIIGMGRIGKVHLTSISNFVTDARVTAIADPLMNNKMEDFAKNFGVKKIYSDYKKILEDDTINAVLVCSSTDTHSIISIEAINAGKHVFCEKPVDHSIKKIMAVKAALAKNPVKFQVGFNRRYDHNFMALRAAVEEGKIGNIHITKITSRDPAPPSAEYAKVSGGMLLDMTIHDFDMVRFLTGSEVEEIYVHSAVLVDKAIGEAGDIDTAIITMKIADGSLAVIDNSRKASYGYDQRAEIFGNNGMALNKNDTVSNCIISDSSGVVEEKPLHFFLERYMNSFSREMKEFVDAIINNEEIKTGIDAGLKSVAIALAGKKSIDEKRSVKISEII